MNFRRKLLAVASTLMLSLALVMGVQSCTSRAEAMTVKELAGVNVGNIDSLKVFAKWSASTVPTPPAATGPIAYVVSWTRNSVAIRTITTSTLADTALVTPRAGAGAFDTVTVNISARYLNRPSASATLTKIFPGVDARIPSAPVITQVDSI